MALSADSHSSDGSLHWIGHVVLTSVYLLTQQFQIHASRLTSDLAAQHYVCLTSGMGHLMVQGFILNRVYKMRQPG